ncbi:MAG: type II toxin-antitoxin system prevent-host-death family antitoxin [Sulfuricella sp.]|nr:type II toxin-antitoxin system prevent-host-death family antitoxin [Sulfuricella sp.]
MQNVSLSDAKAKLGGIVRLVEAGEEVVITRRGQPIARVIPEIAATAADDLPSLAAFRAKQPPQVEGAGELVRHMRDQDRY